MGARVHQLNASPGGVPKLPIDVAHIGPLGLVGDAVAHPDIHGGPDRAVCMFALERIDALRAEGHAVFPGALGENITTAGLDWALVRPGDRFVLGDAELEVTRYTAPCNTTAPFVSGEARRIHERQSPGWSRVYARVVRPGDVRVGMEIRYRPAAATPRTP